MCPAMQASGITSPGEPCVNPRSSILILRLMLMAHSQANVDIPIRELLEGSRRFGRHVSRLSFGVSSPLMTGSCLDWCDGDIGERADGAEESSQAESRKVAALRRMLTALGKGVRRASAVTGTRKVDMRI